SRQLPSRIAASARQERQPAIVRLALDLWFLSPLSLYSYPLYGSSSCTSTASAITSSVNLSLRSLATISLCSNRFCFCLRCRLIRNGAFCCACVYDLCGRHERERLAISHLFLHMRQQPRRARENEQPLA